MDYSDSTLMSKAERYLKDAKPKEYRELKKNKKELEEYLNLTVQAVHKTAQTLMEMYHYPEDEAYRRAVNQEIYENRID